MDEENNAIEVLDDNKVFVTSDSFDGAISENTFDTPPNQNVRINKLIDPNLPTKISPIVVINSKEQKNQISKSIDYIGALQGFIVLILICMIAIGLSAIFKKD